ncbi:hypothetical protein [Nocardioides sp.]|uniref:hypothetical protein n=1 Tax=Nocardioides sp. TaxID=35761 RepID=UPI002390D08A|nr:hypothetical protein [Nocardioides sp.]MDE0778598.1 hypothetical protein [Nocardioides sp.]
MTAQQTWQRRIRREQSRQDARHAAELESLYIALVRDRIEERGKAIDLKVGARAGALAEVLERSDATAREVAQLHVSCVERLSQSRGERRANAVLASAQLVLVEVMGHLLDRYRDRAVATDA